MPRLWCRAPTVAPLLAALAVLAGGCGGRAPPRTLTVTTTVQSTTTAPALPGAGHPPVVVGDKNFTEQFVLGELYYQALRAQGYSVSLNRNIGATEVTMQALRQGSLSMYPEYIDTWNSAVAGYRRRFRSAGSAYRAGQRYALDHGYELLDPSSFSDTGALAVNFNYGLQNGLNSIGDLVKVESTLTLGAPLQFRTQTDPPGLPAITAAYGVVPAAFKPLDIGEQYQALDQGTVQAADVNTTDGQLISGNYTLLSDPEHVFGFGNVVPVVPLKVIAAEGPQFAATINRVTALLSTNTIRQLNAAVDLDNQDPATVATQFLQAHQLIPPTSP